MENNKNKKFLHLVGDDVNLFINPDNLTARPLNKTHIYNALCCMLGKTPISQKRKVNSEVFKKHPEIEKLLDNTYFKIHDLSGLNTFDMKKSGSHINTTVKKRSDSKMTNCVQLTWYDLKYYIGITELTRFRKSLREKFNINTDDTLENCLVEFHKMTKNHIVIKPRNSYEYEKKSKFSSFIQNISLNDENGCFILKTDSKIKINNWEDLKIDETQFKEICVKYNIPFFGNVDNFIKYFTSNSIEISTSDNEYSEYIYNDDIQKWVNTFKKQHLKNMLSKSSIFGGRDIGDTYEVCGKTTFRGIESSKKFKIELKVMFDESERHLLNKGVGYCTIGDGGLLKITDYKQMTYSDMLGFSKLNENFENENFWNSIVEARIQPKKIIKKKDK